MTQTLTQQQIAEIKASVDNHFLPDIKTARSLIATLEARDAAFDEMLELLSCALDDWEGHNGEIIDRNSPHWTVQARTAIKLAKGEA